MKALVALVDFRRGNKALIADFNKLSQKVEGIARQRNRYIHDPAVIDTDTGIVRRLNITADRELDFNYHDANLENIDKLHTDIRRVINQFDRLHVRALSELLKHSTNSLR